LSRAPRDRVVAGGLDCRAVAVALASAMPVAEADAKIDMLQVGQRLARFELIKPGVHRYVRYLVRGGQRRLLDLWTRRVSFEIGDGQSWWRSSLSRPHGRM
jgi:hypothetical protein